MKWTRFLADGEPRFGQLSDGIVHELNASYLGPFALTGRKYPLDAVRLLCPTMPTKVVCVGLNYRDHAKEMGKQTPEQPCLFIKPETAVIGPGEAIVCPTMSSQVDFEAELGIVVGQTLRRASPDQARNGILGYTCVNDVTARDLQRIDGQWTRAKSFDTFCPIGPWITDEVSPDELEIELRLNGVRRQHSSTSQFVFKSAELVSFVSHVMTLRPGDVIATGTPAGIGPMKPGDLVEVRIEGIGTLGNNVVGEE